MSKTIEKIADATGKGLDLIDQIINEIFHLDSRKIRRVGNAEREQRIQNAITNAKIEKYELAQRTYRRLLEEQLNKQINLENVLAKTKDNLKGKILQPQGIEIDADFIQRVSSVAQDTSEEKIQNLIANILSGKILGQGDYSIRLLDFIHKCSKEDLDVCNKFFALSSPIGLFNMDKINTFQAYGFKEYNIDFEEYNLLIEYNLVSAINASYKNTDHQFIIHFPNRSMICVKNISSFTDHFPISRLSALGKELYVAMKRTASNIKEDVYFENLLAYFRAQGYQTSYFMQKQEKQK